MARPLPNSTTIGFLTGCVPEKNLQVACRVQVDVAAMQVNWSLTVRKRGDAQVFRSFVMSVKDPAVIGRLSRRPELAKLGEEVVNVPYRVVQSSAGDAPCAGGALGILEIAGQPGVPDVLYLNLGDHGCYTWSGVSEGTAFPGSFTGEGGTVYWVPWAVAGGLAAVCITAAAITCGDCSVELGDGWATIGYECNPGAD